MYPLDAIKLQHSMHPLDDCGFVTSWARVPNIGSFDSSFYVKKCTNNLGNYWRLGRIYMVQYSSSQSNQIAAFNAPIRWLWFCNWARVPNIGSFDSSRDSTNQGTKAGTNIMGYNIHSANQIAAFNAPIRWLWFWNQLSLEFQI